MENNLITATLKYFSQSGKSAFITTASNPFSMDSIAGYVNASSILNLEPGSTFKMPQGFTLKPMVNEDGEPFTTKSGEVRMKFVW
tara:strand:+ start:122 stop:376 length:255 start_codon:yes stop_codon:yes gene_type:complete